MVSKKTRRLRKHNKRILKSNEAKGLDKIPDDKNNFVSSKIHDEMVGSKHPSTAYVRHPKKESDPELYDDVKYGTPMINIGKME